MDACQDAEQTRTVDGTQSFLMKAAATTMTTTTTTKAGRLPSRWRALLGATPEALSLFRISLGFLLTCELALRFRFLHAFYSDEGTMPLSLLLPKIDNFYKLVCLHCHFGQLWQQQALLVAQTAAAALFTIGYRTRLMAIFSWYMYTSLILRNTWMYFILDRYFYYLLFGAMFLPLDECWSVSPSSVKSGDGNSPSRLIVNPATIGLKLLVLWIYIDAGVGKLMDPQHGWSYHADPLPALDTYTRHTVPARYLYALLGPDGLRVMTPIVMWVEILAAPVALFGSFLGSSALVTTAVALICQLHAGIALSIRNSVLLSYVACSAWCVYFPVGWDRLRDEDVRTAASVQSSRSTNRSKFSAGTVVSALLVGGMAAGNIWFETIGSDCSTGSLRRVWSTLLQNRWNVFIGAEEYVTWEIAPGRLADGSVVDVWGRRDEVEWRMPGNGAPCTSTSRPGRWRSFPYLADFDDDPDQVEALWGYLCAEWDRENDVEQNPGRQLLRFNFFMLQADVLPNMGFSATRKRLVRSYECVKEEDISGQQQDVSPASTLEGRHGNTGINSPSRSAEDEF